MKLYNNGMGVQNQETRHSQFYRPPRPDDFILQEALWSIGHVCAVDPRFLDVQVKRGALILHGEVSTPRQKRLISECVQDIPGVKHVENQIKIMRVSRFTDEHSMHGF